MKRRKITKEELQEFLRKHKLWLDNEDGGERADLSYTDLDGANLVRANLDGANLDGANLVRANLDGANLVRANLVRANLDGANLVRANLDGANLVRANLDGARCPICCPEYGAFIAFKKARGHIVRLQVTEDAKRCSATSRKCRCSKAKVLAIENLDGTESDITEIASDHDKNFIYRVGEIVEVADFCDNRWKECSQGIHFFITRQEAVDY